MRRDRKRQVAPYVPEYVREFVHEVAGHLRISDGEATAKIVMAALHDIDAITSLAPYLLRGYTRGNRAWMGHRNHDDLKRFISPVGAVMERISMRLDHDDWASLDALGFALAAGTAPCAAALLRLAYDDQRIIQVFAPDWCPSSPFALRGEMA